MPDSDRVHVIVTLDGTRPMKEVTRELQQTAGFEVDSEMEAINNVTGWVTAKDKIAPAKSVGGVSDVAEDTSVDIGPPDSPTTW